MSHNMEDVFSYAKSNFTNTIHNEVYPAIDPMRSDLSQKGKTVLITGGGDNLGLCIAHAFVKAEAKIVIIIGRRADVLRTAKSQLEEQIAKSGGTTEVKACTVDIANSVQIEDLWRDFQDSEIIVDVLVSNAAKPPQPTPILDDPDDIWAQVETNAKAPMYMMKKLYSQPGNTQKVGICTLQWTPEIPLEC
jgi:NAD(P)-dependent dehydrogenase (short-subunit alcohol dehydrogenase family)